MIHQRTPAGLAAARAQGRVGGRPTVMEARVFASTGAALPGSGMHWRGRLSAVLGWSFGLLEPTPPVGAIDNPGHHG
jgi:hypothetical protein